MTDISNPYPSWGESGSPPPNGFFYEQGDQVNEKHLDFLWAQADEQTDEFIQAIERRVSDLDGNVVLDTGLTVTDGSGTREVDISSSNAGAYVDGQYTGSVSANTLTLSSNSTGTTRTDVIWVDDTGTLGETSGTTTVQSNQKKLAEVDVADGGDVTDIRESQRYHVSHIRSDTQPTAATRGDLWHDTSSMDDDLNVYENGAWRKVLNDTYSITVNAGNGLKGGGSISLDSGSKSLDIEPADFAGPGLQDDGNDALQVNTSTTSTSSGSFTRMFAGTGINIDAPDPDQQSFNNYVFGKVNDTWVSSISVDQITITNITYSGGFDDDGSSVAVYDLEQDQYVSVGNLTVASQGDSKTYSFNRRRIGGVRIQTTSDTSSSESANIDEIRVREYDVSEHSHDIQP